MFVRLWYKWKDKKYEGTLKERVVRRGGEKKVTLKWKKKRQIELHC